ncbi:MAG: leucine-rich repeat domain-containing protein [Lachnospiraceae bacterium]|nr:leucine-rich repeat domain-containing protein [Lachnospiraceae bacterium]
MKRMKQVSIGVLLVVAILVGIPSVKVEATNAVCDVYHGENAENQNYTRWARPIESYLTVLADGSLMRVQYGSEIEGLLVEYYDKNYNVISSKIVAEELPIWGGFYATEGNYFVVTGQYNTEESADKEVFRITKYDTEWNKLGTASLRDCNTTVPFDAGSCRMDVSGKYLLIRTSHEMYKSSDGYNHQANVTMEVDMETMTITDSYTNVMNISIGYVSHSFNQFIKLDNNQIVAVDHGDAYPRSIVIIKYPTDVSTGKFVPRDYSSYCSSINVLAFPGEIGQNATGASVGGFEISNSKYLIAGNTVAQDDSNLTRTTRNVFVAAVDKETSTVSMNLLTSYDEGDGTTSTPQLVKISSNNYMMLWSREGKVYYALVDGTGQMSGNVHSMAGELSDCVPVVCEGKIVWYTWNENEKNFYDIDIADLSTNRKVEVPERHAWDAGVVTKAATATQKGEKTYTCSVCKTTKTEEISAIGTPAVDEKIIIEDASATYKIMEANENGNAVIYEAPTDKESTSVVVPAIVTINGITYKVTAISDTAFAGSKKLTSVTIGDNVTEFSAKTFKGCTNLKTLNIGNSVTSIPANAFKNFKKLTTVKMGAGVKTIGKNAFYGCKALKTITIGKNVTKIGDKAFYGCSKMKTLTIKSSKLTTKKIGNKAFTKTPKSITVKVPKKKFKAYKSMLIKRGVNKKAKFKKS